MRLLNLIEDLSADLRDAQVENQRLRDEVNRLKGEQGKPNIKANTPKPVRVNHSSERERHKPRQHTKRSKKIPWNGIGKYRHSQDVWGSAASPTV